jgi:hypothetical protein
MPPKPCAARVLPGLARIFSPTAPLATLAPPPLPAPGCGSISSPGRRMALHHGANRVAMFAVSAHEMPPFLPVRLPSHLLFRCPFPRNQTTTSCMSLAFAHAAQAVCCSRSFRPCPNIFAHSSFGNSGTASAACPRLRLHLASRARRSASSRMRLRCMIRCLHLASSSSPEMSATRRLCSFSRSALLLGTGIAASIHRGACDRGVCACGFGGALVRWCIQWCSSWLLHRRVFSIAATYCRHVSPGVSPDSTTLM